MKKQFLLVPAFVATAMIFTGCAMCTDPFTVSCTEPTHKIDKSVKPESIEFTSPRIVPTRDTFRPTFAAGTQRFTATGSGTSREEALYDAFINFKAAANCDFIVAANISVVKSTHPTWRLFATTNYTVTLSGLPITLDKLIREETKEVKEAPKQAPIVNINAPALPSLTKADVTAIIRKELGAFKVTMKPEHKCNNLGLLRLSDIDVQIKAKGNTPSDVGVVFPANKDGKK